MAAILGGQELLHMEAEDRLLLEDATMQWSEARAWERYALGNSDL